MSSEIDIDYDRDFYKGLHWKLDLTLEEFDLYWDAIVIRHIALERMFPETHGTVLRYYFWRCCDCVPVIKALDIRSKSGTLRLDATTSTERRAARDSYASRNDKA